MGETGTPANNGNFGTERNTTKTASVRKQLGTKNSKRKEYRKRMVELRDDTGVQRSFDRETGEEQTSEKGT